MAATARTLGAMTGWFRREDLDLGPILGRGGQGSVYRVGNLRIDQCWDAVYKEYRQDVLHTVDLQALERIVEALPGFQPSDARWLRDNTAWPAGLVEQGGQLRGFLMRSVPDEFFFTPLSLSANTVNNPKVCGFQFLFNSDAYMNDVGLAIGDHERLMLLAFLAGSLHRLHRLGIAIGDLSPKNLLFRITDRPACFFIDCDAMRVSGSSVLPQMETPDWELPAGEEFATPLGDRYKLGLLAIRMFNRSQNLLDLGPLDALSADLGAIARGSLSRDPGRRPPPVEWLEALNSAANSVVPNMPLSSNRTTANAYTANRGAYQATGSGVPRNTTAQRIVLAPPSQFVPPPGWVPPPPTSYVPPRRVGRAAARTFGGLVATAAVLAGLTGAGIGIDHALRNHPGYSPSVPTVNGASDNDVVASSAPPTVEGIVQIDSSIVGDSRAAGVASMFDTYFRAINGKNYPQALAEYDPSGVVNPNDSAQVSEFDRGVSTSQDSQIVLQSVGPSGTGLARTADLTFQSSQDAGYGPPDNPAETCTDWKLTYKLSDSPSGGYLIMGTQSASDNGC